MSEQAQVTWFRLFVAVPRIIGEPPFDPVKLQTQEDHFVVGDIPAASEMHAVKSYWDHCPHIKPALLDVTGKPIRKARMKRKDLFARPKRPDDPGVHPTPDDKPADCPA